MYCLSAPESLKICTINVCGLKSKLVYPEFEDLINEHDFVCVTESKLDNYDSISIENYGLITSNWTNFRN